MENSNKINTLFKKLYINLLCNTSAFKVAYLSIVSLVLFPLTFPIYNKLIISMLIWGIIILLNDLCTTRNMFKIKYSKLLIVFLILYAITLIINYKNNFIYNIGMACYVTIYFLIFYAIDKKTSARKLKTEILILSNIYIIINTIASIVSFIMYIFRYNVVINGYEQGVVFWDPTLTQLRLCGIYSNPNTVGMAVVISAMFIVLNLYIYNHNHFNTNTQKYWKIFYMFSLIPFYLCLVLSDSLEGYLSLCLFLFVVIFFYLYFKYKGKKYSLIRSFSFPFLLLTIFMLLSFSLRAPIGKLIIIKAEIKNNTVMQQTTIRLSALTTDQPTFKSVSQTIIQKDEQIGRPIAGRDLTSGRMLIYENALKIFLQHPIWGIGAKNIDMAFIDTFGVYANTNPHNGYLHTMISSGILGASIIFIFLIMTVFRSLRIIFQNNLSKNISIMLLGMVISLLFYNLFASNLLFSVGSFTAILWLVIGYLNFFINNPID